MESSIYDPAIRIKQYERQIADLQLSIGCCRRDLKNGPHSHNGKTLAESSFINLGEHNHAWCGWCGDMDGPKPHVGPPH